jgi:PAS domain S-box-containing protein
MEKEKPQEKIVKELEELRLRIAELEAASIDAEPEKAGESEAYFRALVENSYDLIVLLDNEGSMRYVSPSCEALLGYEPYELVGRNPLEFIHDDDKEKIAQEWAEALQETGGSAHSEYRIEHKDGSWRIFEAISTSLFDEPSVSGVVINVRDITDYRRMEEELRASEERYRKLIENLNDVIFNVDTSGIITYMSPAIERISKYKVEDIVGKPFTEFVHPDDLPGLLGSFERTLDGILEPYEFRVLDKDGSVLHVETSSRPLEKDGDIMGLIGMMTEITERKQADEAKKRTEEYMRAQIRRRITYFRGPG